jgi:inosose dehydratase
MEVEGWSPPLQYGQVLDEITTAGYEGTELGPYGFLPTAPDVLRRELAQRRLAMISAFVPLRLKDRSAELEPLRVVAKLLQSLGSRFVVLADILWPERERVAGGIAESGVRLNEEDWRNVASNLETAIETAAQYGLRCVFHPHAGTYIETAEEVDQLLSRSSVGLCLDTGHCVFGGGDPVATVQQYGPRVEYLHFKDIDPSRIGAAGFLAAIRNGVFRPLGEGCVRFHQLREELASIGYDGWAVVEQDVDAEQAATGAALKSAIASRGFLKEVFGT